MNIPTRLGPVLAAFSLAACGGAAAPAPPLAGARIGGPFALVDGQGRRVTDRSFAGRWRVMYFGYTSCPDVCPTDAAAIGAGLKRLEASDPAKAARVTPLFVTIDPARDTPAAVGAFARAFHPRMVGLTGGDAEIARVAKDYGVFYARGSTSPGGGYLMQHSNQAYLMDPAGRPVALLPADQGPAAVADALERWVS